MIGKLNHIAIAVPNINEAAEQYRSIFGAKVSEPVEQPDHGAVSYTHLTLPTKRIV